MGIYSSRGIEKACRRDINLMWLFNGVKTPDYSTIARFRNESEENYMYLETNKINPFIKPLTFDTIKKKNFKNKIGRYENMDYNPILDIYTCYNNRKLKHTGNKTRKSKSGYQSTVTIYECESCDDCPHKSKCTKAKGNKRLEISKLFSIC